MRVLQINVTYGFGSTGKLVKSIHELLLQNGDESMVASGRHHDKQDPNLYPIGSSTDVMLHGIKSRVLDRHGFGSKKATLEFIKDIHLDSFDIIHLHNIHGYYINIEVLMNALKKIDKPIIWTLHDAWAYTGHCAYYDMVSCEKWKTGCHHCPQKHTYPSSLLIDQSKRNYSDKKMLFSHLKNVTLVTPSEWLKNEVSHSFLSHYRAVKITNGIELSRFKTQDSPINKRFTVLAVANYWEDRKGLDSVLKLSEILPEDMDLVVVGQLQKGIKLPERIQWIPRTNNENDLITLYKNADCFINPTVDDNLPTTSIEAIAAGTPVITYDTGGSGEIIDSNTGILVKKYDVQGLLNAIMTVKEKTKKHYEPYCIKRSQIFNHEKMVESYIKLYKEVVK